MSARQVGSRGEDGGDLQETTIAEVLPSLHFQLRGGYWLLPLSANTRSVPLGVLGVEVRAPLRDLAPEERAALALLGSNRLGRGAGLLLTASFAGYLIWVTLDTLG